MWKNPSLAILRPLSQSCGKLKRATELRWRNSNHTAEDLRGMARAGVADLEPDIDETARSFADQLLCARYALAADELEGSHASGLLGELGQVRGSQLHQLRESFGSDLAG